MITQQQGTSFAEQLLPSGLTERMRESGLMLSELRILGGQIDEFKVKVEELSARKAPSGEFNALYRGFSLQIELAATSMYDTFGTSFSSQHLHQLYSACRTYLEEAILERHKEPSANGRFTAELLQREFALALQVDFGLVESWFTCRQREQIILEFDPHRLTVRDEIFSQLETICSELVIDLSRQAPQEGFGRSVTASELRDEMRQPGARLFVPTIGGGATGLYVMYAEPEAIPAAELGSIKEYQSSHATGSYGLATVVGISKEGRELIRAQGKSAYRLLTDAVLESALGLGLSEVFSEVRVGRQGNLARDKHLASGWEATGIIRHNGTFPYELLRLPCVTSAKLHEFSADWRLNLSPMPDCFGATPRSKLGSIARNFSVEACPGDPRAGTHRAPNGDVSREMRLARRILGAEFALSTKTEFGRVQILAAKKEKTLAIKQKVANADFWKVEHPVYYERGLDQPLVRFRDALTELKRGMRD